jgi:hypothetical protein
VVQRHIYIALTNAIEGRDAEFIEWYSEHHLREIVQKIPGFLTGRLYGLNALQQPGRGARPMQFPYKYLAIYQIEMDDIGSIDRALEVIRRETPNTSHNGKLDPDHRGWVYTPTGQHAEAGPGTGGDPYLLAVFTNPASGREEDFSSWYGIHLKEWVTLGAGYVRANRYSAHSDQRRGQDVEWQSLALYELELDDVGQFHDEEATLMDSGQLTPADGAFDQSDLRVWLFLPLTAEVQG